MKNLKAIIKKANTKLCSQTFSLNDDKTIWNTTNRYEGNDIDMSEEKGVFKLTATGIHEEYLTIESAVQGLIDMYTEE
jgi:hypothetical protein